MLGADVVLGLEAGVALEGAAALDERMSTNRGVDTRKP